MTDAEWKEMAIKIAMNDPKIKTALDGKEIIRVIVIRNKLINFVVK